MAFTHYLVRTYTTSGASVSKTATVTGGLESNVDEALSASSANVTINWQLDQSACQGLMIVATNAVTLCTNDLSSGSPDQTLELTADKPYTWAYGDYASCPITTDVTALYASCTTACTLSIRALVDPTP